MAYYHGINEIERLNPKEKQWINTRQLVGWITNGNK